MSLWLNLGQLATRAGGLLPTIDHLISWLTRPTADGKTLANSKGVDATLTAVNCLDFDGSGDYVKVDSSGGVDLTTDAGNNFGSCVITATFKQEVATTQAIYSNGSAAYRLFTQNNFLKVNSSSAEIFAIELNKVYQSTITYNANGQLTNFVLENLTDGTTQTDSNIRPAGSHGGSGGFQIGARNGGLSWKGKISNVSVSNSSVGANIHLPLAEGSGSVAYDVSGNGANGTIINATHSTLDGIESWNHEYGFDAGAVLDGSDDYVNTGVSDQLVKKYSVTFTPTVISDAVILGLRISRPACFELMSDGSMRTALFEGESRDNSTGANRTTTTTLVAGAKYTVEVDYDNNEIKINDVVQSTFVTSGRNHTNDNVWIGGRQDGGALQHPFNGIIHNVKLESATAVIRDFVPSEDGLYDKVNGVYYSNDGTGTPRPSRLLRLMVWMIM